ncbi:MAG: Dna2/Cas4 domain-containing protein [Candidatus Aminicenantes bacterium]|nr:Dna2/Cas4 domain-containing protein [Candidatus Aminicenantes bacterium]
MAAFSHSRLSTFETCKLQYKFAYIDRIKVEREDTVETFLGSLVHEALEKLYQDLQYEKLVSLDELLEYFDQEWARRWNDTIVVVKKEYTADNYRKMGEKYLRDYYQRHEPFQEGKVLGLETQNFLSLDDESRYKYHIRIDRLVDRGEGVYEVHDYKTNKKLPSQEELDQDRQLAMYSLWVRSQFKDFHKVRLVWHFLAFDKEMDSERSAEELEQLRQNILGKIHEIESTEEYPATVTTLCNWCLYRDVCPMWKHEAALEVKPENEYLNDPGLQLVDEYVRIKEELDVHKKEAEATLSELKAALIAFCEQEDLSAVAGTDKKITISRSQMFKLPGKNTPERRELEIYLKNTQKYDEVSCLDTFALAKFLKQGKWDEATRSELSRFTSEETSYRLNISKR